MADQYSDDSDIDKEDKGTDIVIQLADNTSCPYNVSKFLREHSSSHTDIDELNTFIQTLDKHVHIDASEPKYNHIYKGVDAIMKRLVSELAKVDSFFAHTKLRPTGSIHSNVKVGLPHESDYLLEVPENKTLKTSKAFKKNTLYDMVATITRERHRNLIEGLQYWTIHGIKYHSYIGGICLIMQCPSNENCQESEQVGFTVDLVPVYVLTSTDDTLTDEASRFLPFSLQQYAERGDLYRLTTEEECDTGLIENQIMNELPENKKRVFRVLKFLNQNLHNREPNINIDKKKARYNRFRIRNITVLDAQACLRLYGYKPRIPSYHLRLVFLRLLLGIHGTTAEEELTDGRLLLCLMDLMTHIGELSVYSTHPLIKLGSALGFNDLGSVYEPLQKILTTMRSNDGHVSLLNY